MPRHSFSDRILCQHSKAEHYMSQLNNMSWSQQDLKLIRTLINIERHGTSDLFFGAHSLLEIFSNTAIRRLPISGRLWQFLREYGELGGHFVVGDKLFESIPRMSNLVELNMAFVATDKACFLVAKNLPKLEVLDLRHSFVTDRGLRFLSGLRPSSQAEDTDADSLGSFSLRKISLDMCRDVTEAGVWTMVMRLPQLRIVSYHETFSLAEVLVKESGLMSESDLQQVKLKLESFVHPFPYGLYITDDMLLKVVALCPYITELNIVTSDPYVSGFATMNNLRVVNIELEDCFGEGLVSFLDKIGTQLEDLAISCSSDSDSTFLAEGGQSFQLFNVGLHLARTRCGGETLKRLSIAGCGLVSNSLLTRVKLERETRSPQLKVLSELERLIFLSYEEDDPVQTCEGHALLNLLQGCPKIKVVNLEGNFAPFLDDDFVVRLLRCNALAELEVLDTQGRSLGLTLASAARIISLPKMRELRVSKWSMTEEEFKKLKKDVSDRGWDFVFRR